MNVRVRELGGLRAVSAGTVSETDLALINMEYSRVPLAAEDIHVRRARVCHNQHDRTFERFPKAYLERFAETLPGKSLLPGHDKTALPLGRWFLADTRTRTEDFPALIRPQKGIEVVPGFASTRLKVTWLEASFYFTADESNELFRKNVDNGVYQDDSIGFSYDDVACDACGKSYIRSDCPHVKGEKDADSDQLVTLTYSGDPQQAEALEASIVFLGAQQHAEFIKSLCDGTVDPQAFAKTPYGVDLVRLKEAEFLARKHGHAQKVWATGSASTILAPIGAKPPSTAAVAATGDKHMTEQEKLEQATADELRAELSASSKRADLAEAKAAEAQKALAALEPLAEVGKAALTDLKAAFLAHCTRLERGEKEICEVAELLAAAGNYKRLKELHDEAWEAVCKRYPAELSADVAAATTERANGKRTLDPEAILAMAGR